jgi:hypothetical protein
VARTLADLTNKFSRDLSALEAKCSKEMETIEEQRDTALLEIPFARKILRTYSAGLEKAKAAQLKSTQNANEIRDNEISAAEEKRSVAAFKAEQKYRRSKDKAFRTRQSALRKAKKKWKAELEKIRQRPLTEQRTARNVADKVYEDAIESAGETYQESIGEARLAHQAKLQDILVEERLAFEKANHTAKRMISSAVVAYERAVAHEETKMRIDLSEDEAAAEIQANFDRRLFEIRQDCERKREELFKQFTKDRKQLVR